MATGAAHFAFLAPAMGATAFAIGHDMPAARRAMVLAAGRAETSQLWDVAQGAFLALPDYWMPAEAGQWPAALAGAHAMDAALEAERANRPVYGLMQQVWIWPLEAQALARTGDLAAAEALIGKTPLDCYLCLRVRGAIAAQTQDWAGADRWFTEAVRLAPSSPFAEAEWAEARLARGDADGALALAKRSASKGPRFADPVEIWGEALMAKGDYAGAEKKFAEAGKLAPSWGRNHLKAAEALARLGKAEGARKELRAAARLDLTPPERAELAAQARV